MLSSANKMALKTSLAIKLEESLKNNVKLISSQEVSMRRDLEQWVYTVPMDSEMYVHFPVF